jgi:hypothetical protein
LVKDSLSISQGSVLLAEQCLSSDNHAGCAWLDVAIRHARLLGAHNCHNFIIELSQDKKEARKKRQLWRCIIIRDMVISMGLRLPAKITRAHFELNDILSTVNEDFNNNPYLSQAFSMLSRSTLAQLFCLQLRLASIAIDVSTLVYSPSPDFPAWWFSLVDFRKVTDEIRRVEGELDQWAAASVASVFTLSDTLSLSSAVKSYRQLILIHYQYVLDIPTPLKSTNVLDQYYTTCLVPA